ncbi:MAG: TonB-dependent receptor [Bacteroidia bacterium]|nr:TonB-dependent receptor [Bacteroidia bacterium]
MTRLPLLFALVLLGLLLPAQAQHTLTGKITDLSSGEPLVGAAIAIPALNIGTFSQEDGSYSLSFESSPSLSVRVSFSGYIAQTQDINVEGTTTSLDIALSSGEFTTNDVVITATKGFGQRQADVTVSISVVKPQSIDLQATPNISRVINQIPGVDNQDGQINIRGSSGYAYGVGSRVMVTLDGLPLLTGDAGTAALDLIPVDNIAQVEVMKGASSVLYGSAALGGVINVITADPGATPKTRIRTRAGFYGTPSNKAIDWDGDKNAWFASTHIFHSRQIGALDLTLQTDFIKDQGYRQGTDTERFRGLIMTKYHPKNIPGLTFGVNVSGRVDSSGAMLYWRSYFPDTTEVNGETVVSGGALTPTQDAGGYRRQISSYLAVDPVIKYLAPNGNLFWYRGRVLRNTNRNNSGQSNTNYISYNDFLFQRTLAKRINWVTGATYSFAVANGDSIYGGRHPGTSLGVYTQLDGKFGKLTTSLGFRYETVKIDTLDRESRPVMRAGLNYELWPGANLRSSFGQAFRVPTVAERYANTAGGGIIIQPNPEIRSESGYSLEAGFRQGYQFGNTKNKGAGYLDIAIFQMDYNDMVEFGATGFTAAGGTFSSVNVSRARINGVEITTLNTFNFGKWMLNVSGGITLLDPMNLNAADSANQINLEQYEYPRQLISAIIDLTNPNLSDQPSTLKYRPRQLFRASSSVGYGRFGITGNVRYRSFIETIDQYLFLVVDDLSTFRQKHPNGEWTLDLIASYNLNENSQLSLTVDNVTNTEYLVVPGYLAAQRSFTLQYLIKF